MNKTIRVKTKPKSKECCICGKEITGYGNNAEPVKHGICCDSCNINIVIPNRVLSMLSYKGDKYES